MREPLTQALSASSTISLYHYHHSRPRSRHCCVHTLSGALFPKRVGILVRCVPAGRVLIACQERRGVLLIKVRTGFCQPAERLQKYMWHALLQGLVQCCPCLLGTSQTGSSHPFPEKSIPLIWLDQARLLKRSQSFLEAPTQPQSNPLAGKPFVELRGISGNGVQALCQPIISPLLAHSRPLGHPPRLDPLRAGWV